MTQADLRQGLTLGPERQVIWVGASPLDPFDHRCGGDDGSGKTGRTEEPGGLKTCSAGHGGGGSERAAARGQGVPPGVMMLQG